MRRGAGQGMRNEEELGLRGRRNVGAPGAPGVSYSRMGAVEQRAAQAAPPRPVRPAPACAPPARPPGQPQCECPAAARVRPRRDALPQRHARDIVHPPSAGDAPRRVARVALALGCGAQRCLLFACGEGRRWRGHVCAVACERRGADTQRLAATPACRGDCGLPPSRRPPQRPWGGASARAHPPAGLVRALHALCARKASPGSRQADATLPPPALDLPRLHATSASSPLCHAPSSPANTCTTHPHPHERAHTHTHALAHTHRNTCAHTQGQKHCARAL